MAVEIVADQLAFMQRVSQCLEIVLKSTMICSDMICVGKSPRMFYLPPDMQVDRRVLGETLSRQYLSNDVGGLDSFDRVPSCQTLTHANSFFFREISPPMLGCAKLLMSVKMETSTSVLMLV
jgi:hypothetical protein